MSISVKQISAEATLPLRCAILRPGLPVSESCFPNDAADGAAHFGAYDDDAPVAVGSIFIEDHDQFPGAGVWRLRGMAVAAERQGQGLGRLILETCHQHIRSAGGGQLWCNARCSAKAFYDKAGYVTHGEPFDIPGISLHVLMSRAIEG